MCCTVFTLLNLKKVVADLFFCNDCIIRNAVNRAFEGFSTIREKCKLELKENEKIYNFFALITVTPIFLKNKYALVLIENIAEILLIPQLLPICLKCKKIKRDIDYWEHIENYLKEHFEINFTHGYCPECFEEQKRLIEKYLDLKKEKT